MNDPPAGWYLADETEKQRLEVELRLELAPSHKLYGEELAVYAHRDGGTDDILCRDLNDPGRWIVVHLTWKMGPEIDGRYPWIECDGTFEDFLQYEARFGLFPSSE